MKVVEHSESIILTENVGFTSIPDQIREKSIEKGFQLNILVVGRRGLGTKTLINSVYNASLLSSDRSDDINTIYNEIVDNSVRLRLGITTCHKILAKNEIFEFIRMKNCAYFDEEKLVFNNLNDQRIHVCLFMLPNDRISDDEINLCNSLSQICNVIPIIAKADIYTETELNSYIGELENKLEMSQMYSKIECVSASEDFYDAGGIQIRGRKYPWGFIEVEKILDFTQLQRKLVYEDYEELTAKTDEIFYYKFRQEYSKVSFDKSVIYNKLVEQMKTIMNRKHSIKKEMLEREEIDLEKFLSATKLTTKAREATAEEIQNGTLTNSLPSK